ncbi:MAG: type II toxin-antitoxin system Phd/YefM family antitoxin [Gammaproteobacteria bacterium]
MRQAHSVGKRDFIQHTSRYLKEAELSGSIIITHQNKPVLKITRIEDKTIKDLKGNITHINIIGDINDPILPGYDEW